MLKFMTWHGTALRMMRYKGMGSSGIPILGRRSASRGPLPVEAERKKFVLSEVANASRCIHDEKEKANVKFIERRWLHHRSKSFWSCRGGEIGTGDKATTKASSSNDGIKREFSSSSSDTSSSESTKSNQRTISPIGPRTYQISVGTEQGFRSYMEDEYYVSNDGDFAAVFDGHGGPAVSRYLRKNLYANVQAFLPLTVLEKQGDRPFADNDIEGDNAKDKSQVKEETDDKLIENDLSPSPPSISSTRRQRPPTVNDYANALESALEKVDSEILKISHWSFQGSTAIVIWLHEDHDERATSEDKESPTAKRTILAANIGDSRAVLCRDNKAWDLSRDHKPNDPTEKSRIESIGGSVIWCGDTDKFGNPIHNRGIYRVNGNLALSRAIGDRSERPHVTAEPEIISVPVRKDDQFVIVATDGLWDVMDSDDAVNYVKLSLKAGISKNKIADVMVQEAMRLGTYDNVTVVIIWIDSR
jgi:protein phosphatase 1L